LRELALFAGAGGGILGGQLLGWRPVCAVEINAFCCRRLMQRQNEGHLPPFPIWDDVRTFSGFEWRGIIDVVSGGFPCQDISAAGGGAGLDGARSGLWLEFARIVREVRPRYVFVENSSMLTSRGLNRVLGDLAGMGFDAKWGVLGASDLGADHERKRIWILAYASGIGQHAGKDEGRIIPKGACRFTRREVVLSQGASARVWPIPISGIHRMADDLAGRMDRLKALGNGQVPRVAATAWEILSQ
jgi:DNA (cytosine-5)-methyltransferase 1